MKPIRLTIKGLNSFKEKQVIDFERLTERGLFGIFGPTGSGKSTILDAITYALYGKITRDNTGFVNVTEDSAFVGYEFEVGKGNDRFRYVVERSIKVTKDSNENSIKNVKYKTPKVRLMIKDESVEGGLRIIAEKVNAVNSEIENIIGLKLEDFTRAVVLPQGKFSEFLKSNPAERRDMLERIFGLERYGRNLIAKVKAESKRVEIELSDLNGKLSQYEGVTKEGKEKLEGEVKDIIRLENQLSKKADDLKKLHEEYKVIWGLQEELNVAERERNILNDKSFDINEKREKMKKGKTAANVFPFIEEYDTSIKKYEGNRKELERLTSLVNEYEEKLKVIKESYEKAYFIKEQQLPTLLSKEANLKQAVEISFHIEELNKDIQNSKNRFEASREDEKTTTNKINEVIIKNQELKESKINLEESILGLKIEPEWREKINNAVNSEAEYERLNREREVITKKKDKTIDEINKKEGILQRLKEDKQINTTEMEKIKNQSSLHKENCPGNNDDLLKMHKSLSELENDYTITAELETKISKDNMDLANLEKELKEAETKLVNEKEKQNAVSTQLKNISAEIEGHIKKNYAAYLAENLTEEEPCPVCGSLHHINLAKTSNEDNSLIEEMKLKENDLEKSLSNINNQVEKLNGEFSIKQVKYNHLKEEQNGLIEKIQNKDSQKLKAELISKNEEFQRLKSNIETWTKERETLEESLDKINKDNNYVETQIAVCEEGLKKDKNILLDFQEELKEKLEKLQSVYEDLEKYKAELKVSDLQKEQRRIRNCDNEIKIKEQELLKVKNQLEKLENLKKKLDEKLSVIKTDKATIEQSIKEKSEVMKKQIETQNKLSENREPNSYLVEIKNTIKNIVEEEKKLKEKLDDANKQFESTKENKLRVEENGEILTKLCDSQESKLKKALVENNYANSEEVRKYILSKDIIESLEIEIKSYDDNMLTIENQISRLNEKLKDRRIEKEQWDKLLAEKEETEKLLSEKHDMKINLENELKSIIEKLNIVKEFTEEKQKVEHKKSMLQELATVTKGNKLVEFMAMKKLRYVAQEASKRLKDITSGQFALELDEDGSFIMRDDKNGGFRRYTDSLSGGETFLTSLCLALSLSTQIQLKNAASLEFFFLDEGFGTLDSNLLDTVMMSLEKLHSNKLSVGIISHVEELKNRVPLKLLVTPSSFGEGSKVRIEMS